MKVYIQDSRMRNLYKIWQICDWLSIWVFTFVRISVVYGEFLIILSCCGPDMGNTCVDFKKLGVLEMLDHGEARLRSYHFVRLLKSTRLTSVWLVQNKQTKKLCALKQTKKLVVSRSNVVHLPANQQAILKNLNHSLISNIIEAFQDRQNLYIVLEYMPCGSLREYLGFKGCLTESQTRFATICLLIALEYLHKQHIMHMDIKPENLLIDEKGYFRLSDFNLSMKCEHKIGRRRGLAGVGTYGYQAPEIIQNPAMIGKQSDLYSLGVMCIEMLTGINKRNIDNFTSRNLKQILEKNTQFSKNCIDFICKMLEEDPLKRLGARDNFQQIWKHPWLEVSPTQRLQYTCKEVPSFVHEEYRKNKLRKEEEACQREVSDESGDEMVDHLRLKDYQFQSMFAGFKTFQLRDEGYIEQTCS